MGEVLSRLERKGFIIDRIDGRLIDRELAERHYAEHKGRPFYGKLLDYITSDLSVIVVLSGENVIENVRMVIGATDPLEATPGSIRGAYATSMTFNLVHGSDSPESALREIALFFPDEE